MNLEPVQSFNCKKLNSQTEAHSGMKSTEACSASGFGTGCLIFVFTMTEPRIGVASFTGSDNNNMKAIVGE